MFVRIIVRLKKALLAMLNNDTRPSVTQIFALAGAAYNGWWPSPSSFCNDGINAKQQPTNKVKCKIASKLHDWECSGEVPKSQEHVMSLTTIAPLCIYPQPSWEEKHLLLSKCGIKPGRVIASALRGGSSMGGCQGKSQSVPHDKCIWHLKTQVITEHRKKTFWKLVSSQGCAKKYAEILPAPERMQAILFFV